MRNKLLKNILSSATLCSICLFFSTGCSTVDGVGKDLSKAGQVISDASRKESSK